MLPLITTSPDNGVFIVQPKVTNISYEDTIAIGYGNYPSFVSVVYGISGQKRTPIRSTDYPKLISVGSGGDTDDMWIFFTITSNRHGILQHETVSNGFMFTIERTDIKSGNGVCIDQSIIINSAP